MPQTLTRRISAAIAALLLAGALGLAACGSSSNSSSASTSASAPATTTGSTSSGATTATAPQPSTATTTTSSPSSKTTTTGASTPAKTTTSGGASKTVQPTSGASATLRQCLQKNGINLAAPVNTTQARAQLQAAVAKCAAAVHLLSSGILKPSSAVSATLVRFADCLRQNGVNVPKPSTSGGLNTSGLDTSSATYKAALAKCRSILLPPIHIPGVPGGATTIPGVPTG